MIDNPYQSINELLALAREEEERERQAEIVTRPQANMSPFAKKLRSIRTRKGVRQGEVAMASGVSPAQVSKLERGSRSPTRDVVDAMARALDASDRERNELLHAAGFSVDDDDNVRRFRELPPSTQRALLAMVDIVRGEVRS